MQFPKVTYTEPPDVAIETLFDIKLNINGGWGYEPDDAIILLSPLASPLTQLEFTLASMRTHIEMNLMLPEEKRYGGINLKELTRTLETIGSKSYEKVRYEVTAIPETLYKSFIQQYKEGYENPDFDLQAHFDARKEATLSREIVCFFNISSIQEKEK